MTSGTSARDVLDNGLLAGMDVIGKRFTAGDMFIPEVLLCARTMHGAMDILKPLLSERDQAGVRDQVKIMAGGASVTQDFIDKIGADAYDANGTVASEKAKALLA